MAPVSAALRKIAANKSLAAAARIGEMAGKLAIFVTVIAWLAQSGDRSRSAVNADWQVVSLAQAQKANAGRIDALEDLNRRHVDLYGLLLTDGAKLRGLNLQEASLSEATITSADLTSAHFERANLMRAQLHGSTLVGVHFDDAAVVATDFSSRRSAPAFNVSASTALPVGNTSLRGATFGGAFVCEANFVATDLTSARFGEPGPNRTPVPVPSRGPSLSSAPTVTCTPQSRPTLLERFAKRLFKGKSFAQIAHSDFADALADSADFSSTYIQDTSFRGLRRQRPGWAVLTRTQTFSFLGEPLPPLPGSSPAIYIGSYSTAATVSSPPMFTGAYLSGVNFESANLSGVSFENATLEQVSFSGACLNSASFKNATLHFVDFDGAVFDDNTDFRNASIPTDQQYTPGGPPGDATLATIAGAINSRDALFDETLRKKYIRIRFQRHDARQGAKHMDLSRFVPRPRQYRPGASVLCFPAPKPATITP